MTLSPSKHPDVSDRAERSVIGSMLRWPAIIDDVALRLRPDDMRKDAHQRIFRTILELHGSVTVDLVTLANALKEKGDLETVGGAVALAQLYDSEPTGANAVYYADIVREAFLRRSITRLGSQMRDEGERPSQSAVDALATFEQQLWSLSELGVRGQAEPLNADYDRVTDNADRRNSGHEGDELPTGFEDLDTQIVGLRPGHLCVIAARPSGGKTALGLNIARNLAVRKGVPVQFASLEQSRYQIAARNISSFAHINGHFLNAGRLSRDEAARVSEAIRTLKKAPFYVDDDANQSCHRIAANARRLVRRAGVKALFVDYLQLITPDDRKAQRYEQVGQISRRLKGIAKELNIPVVAMAQLSRQADERREPRLSDLRESGNIECDADEVLLLHRDQDENSIAVEVIVAKQRDGPQGRLTLAFMKEYVCFENYCDNPFTKRGA